MWAPVVPAQAACLRHWALSVAWEGTVDTWVWGWRVQGVQSLGAVGEGVGQRLRFPACVGSVLLDGTMGRGRGSRSWDTQVQGHRILGQLKLGVWIY